MSEKSEYPYKTSDLAAELDCSRITVLRRAKALSIGLDLGGRAGLRFSELDRRRLLDSMRRDAVPTPKRRRRRSA